MTLYELIINNNDGWKIDGEKPTIKTLKEYAKNAINGYINFKVFVINDDITYPVRVKEEFRYK